MREHGLEYETDDYAGKDHGEYHGDANVVSVREDDEQDADDDPDERIVAKGRDEGGELREHGQAQRLQGE